jgi:tRNA(Arg) A34 adenosine deaminase TadA
MTNDLTFLRAALVLAKENSAAGTRGPFGAIVVRAGKVVGRGGNQVVEAQDPTAHAEVMAIRDASKNLGTHILEDCTIYCSCEPCPMCLSAIYWAHIPRVVYAAASEDARSAGFDDSRIRDELRLPWGDRSVEVMRALPREGARVFELWKKNPDKVPY